MAPSRCHPALDSALPSPVAISAHPSRATHEQMGKQLPVWVNGIDGHIKVEFFDDHIIVTPETISQECKRLAFGRMEFRPKNNEL